MRLDVRSILKAAAWGLVAAVLGSVLFSFVWIPILEAVFTVLLGGFVGFLFGRITTRSGGPDGFASMAGGGCLAAIVPAALVWATAAGLGLPRGGPFDFTLNPSALLSGALLGGLIGGIAGLVGGLIYASRV